MDVIFLFMWKIFGLCDENILQRFFVAQKSLVQCSQAHYSHSDNHMIVVLH
jgi:hypothetical protein